LSKLEKVTILAESGEGDPHCSRSLRTKVSRHSARTERPRTQGPSTNTARTPTDKSVWGENPRGDPLQNV
jgi:hypothetical protein